VVTETATLHPCLPDKTGTLVPKLPFANHMRGTVFLHNIRRKRKCIVVDDISRIA
jgi:hypothetical protein